MFTNTHIHTQTHTHTHTRIHTYTEGAAVKHLAKSRNCVLVMYKASDMASYSLDIQGLRFRESVISYEIPALCVMCR